MIRMAMVILVALGLAGVAHAAQTNTRRSVPAVAAAAGSPVNLNTATVAQLETLPGIGKSTAERIVEYRQKNGGFKKIEDLMNVRGVGEKSFLKLKPLIVVTPLKGTSTEQQQRIEAAGAESARGLVSRRRPPDRRPPDRRPGSRCWTSSS